MNNVGSCTLYLDESGTHKIHNDDCNTQQRYLCLNGVIIGDDKYPAISNQWQVIRDIFKDAHGIAPPIHFTELTAKLGQFGKLRNKNIEKVFNELYLNFLSNADITVITVVIDKNQHRKRYRENSHNVYHAALRVLLDRYVWFLQERNAEGRVIAESRNSSTSREPDDELAKVLADYCTNSGYNNVPLSIVKKHLHNEIIFYTKSNMVVGLEICDMLATVMKYFVLNRYNKSPPSDGFSEDVKKVIAPKIRSRRGKIAGAGIILLP